MKFAIWVFTLALVACGASGREKTISATMTALDASAQAFSKFNGQHELDMVNHSATQAEYIKAVTDYRKTADHVLQDFAIAYRAVAVAATVNDDPSLAGMVTAAGIVAQEIAALGVKL